MSYLLVKNKVKKSYQGTDSRVMNKEMFLSELFLTPNKIVSRTNLESLMINLVTTRKSINQKEVASYLYVDCTSLFLFSPALNQVMTLRMAYPQQTLSLLLNFEFKHHFSEFLNFLIFLPNKVYIFALANSNSASFLIGKNSQTGLK